MLAPMQSLDIDWVRARFPGLDDDLAFFENAGGSVPADAVVDRAHRYLREDMVQLGAAYGRSRRAAERVEEGKRAAARLLGCEVGDVVLGASTSVNFNTLSHALAPTLDAGDEVVVTDLDHETNRGAWIRLARARGARVRTWRLDPASGALTLEGLEDALSPRTRLVCFTHCANVVGTLHDAAAFTARARAAGARVVVDGVAYAPHRRVDVGAVGADVYAFSLYKTFGPHLSAMYVAAPLRARLANQNHDFLAGTGTYELMPGNVSHELAAAVPGITDYLEALDAHHGAEDGAPGDDPLDRAFARVAAHEAALAQRLLPWLREHPRVRLVGEPTADPSRRVPTVTFLVEGRRSMEVAEAAAADGVAIRAGHFYAPRAMAPLGVEDPEDGVVRVSMAHYNTLAEVDRLLASLDRALG